jgi:hypothetical protein
MAATWKTARVFISSTFRDMQAERDHLVRFVFPQLRARLRARRIDVIDVDLRWGVTSDEDAVAACRKIIDECRPWFLAMLGERYGWVPPGQLSSITADEIEYAVLSRPDPTVRMRGLFCLRDPCVTATMADSIRGDFRESEGCDYERRLRSLKQEILGSGLPVYTYGGRWDRETCRLIGLKDFGDRVYSELLEQIDEEFGVLPQPTDEFADDRADTEAFIRQRVDRFNVGARRALLDRLLVFARTDDHPRVLVVTGPPGCGKSALLCKFVDEFEQEAPNVPLISLFVGVGMMATDLFGLLRRLNYELATIAGTASPPARDLAEAIGRFHSLLGSIAQSERLVLLFDAIDQLDDVSDLHWLPYPLPVGVRVLASVRFGGPLSTAKAQLPAVEFVELPPLNTDDAGALVRDYLLRYQKRLEDNVLDNLLAKRGGDSPLYLRVALEELRTFGEFMRLPEVVAQLPEDAKSLFLWILRERLACDPDFRDRTGRSIGSGLVPRFATAMGASRQGLSEVELVAMIDPGDPLGNVAALLRLIRPYLMRRGELYDFAHSQLREAVESEYLRDEADRRTIHALLASFFRHLARPEETDPWNVAEKRALRELPYHLIEAGDRGTLSKLIPTGFIDAVRNALGPVEAMHVCRVIVEALTACDDEFWDELMVAALAYCDLADHARSTPRLIESTLRRGEIPAAKFLIEEQVDDATRGIVSLAASAILRRLGEVALADQYHYHAKALLLQQRFRCAVQALKTVLLPNTANAAEPEDAVAAEPSPGDHVEHQPLLSLPDPDLAFPVDVRDVPCVARARVARRWFRILYVFYSGFGATGVLFCSWWVFALAELGAPGIFDIARLMGLLDTSIGPLVAIFGLWLVVWWTYRKITRSCLHEWTTLLTNRLAWECMNARGRERRPSLFCLLKFRSDLADSFPNPTITDAGLAALIVEQFHLVRTMSEAATFFDRYSSYAFVESHLSREVEQLDRDRFRAVFEVFAKAPRERFWQQILRRGLETISEPEPLVRFLETYSLEDRSIEERIKSPYEERVELFVSILRERPPEQCAGLLLAARELTPLPKERGLVRMFADGVVKAARSLRSLIGKRRTRRAQVSEQLASTEADEVGRGGDHPLAFDDSEQLTILFAGPLILPILMFLIEGVWSLPSILFEFLGQLLGQLLVVTVYVLWVALFFTKFDPRGLGRVAEGNNLADYRLRLRSTYESTGEDSGPFAWQTTVSAYPMYWPTLLVQEIAQRGKLDSEALNAVPRRVVDLAVTTVLRMNLVKINDLVPAMLGNRLLLEELRVQHDAATHGDPASRHRSATQVGAGEHLAQWRRTLPIRCEVVAWLTNTIIGLLAISGWAWILTILLPSIARVYMLERGAFLLIGASLTFGLLPHIRRTNTLSVLVQIQIALCFLVLYYPKYGLLISSDPWFAGWEFLLLFGAASTIMFLVPRFVARWRGADLLYPTRRELWIHRFRCSVRFALAVVLLSVLIGAFAVVSPQINFDLRELREFFGKS